jgi:hypothetical protein
MGHNNSTALFTCRLQKYKHIISADTLITGYFTSTLSTFGFKILLTRLYFRKVSDGKGLLGIFVLHYRFQQCERTVVCKVYIYYFIWGVNSSCSIKQCGLHLKTVRESAGDLGRKRGKRESWRVTLNFLRPKHPMRMTAKT